MIRKIGIVTTSRADFGLLYPLISEIKNSNKFEIRVIATGSHLLKEYGYTVKNVKEKFDFVDIVDLFLPTSDKYSIIKSIGIGFVSFADYFKNNNMDLVIVLGDRVELIVPVYAAMVANIPIAHIFGGDNIEKYVTYDNNIRHCITKLSSLHFTAIMEHAKRIERLGEEKWRIINVGSPAIDYIKRCKYIPKDVLKNKFKKIKFDEPYAVLTFHPVNLEVNDLECQIQNVIKSLNDFKLQVLCTKPNNDVGSEIIMRRIQLEDKINDKFLLVNSLTQEEYYSMLKYCAFMIGNSSSGVLESSSFGIPSINIGTRQSGRIRGNNVIDTDYTYDGIRLAIMKSRDDSFIKLCRKSVNPYGDGNAAKKIVKTLEKFSNDKERLLIKRITF